MLRKILVSALVAGTVAGLAVSAFQMAEVVPLILEAETYEGAGAGHEHGAPLQGTTGAEMPESGAWVPADGLERALLTLLANVLTGIGFALLLGACLTLYRGPLDWRRGVLWGMAGFVAFALAPALGLPPELPGSAAADLVARQAWWLATAAVTAGGLALILLVRTWPATAAGAILIILPHAVGAPHADGRGAVPPELAAQFAVASLAAAGLFWAILGGLSGHLFRRGA
jgi:cobalt transporter subunit CbtA